MSYVDGFVVPVPTDKKQALVSGYLDQTYLVTSVVSGQAEATKAFRWDEGAKEFLEVPL